MIKVKVIRGRLERIKRVGKVRFRKMRQRGGGKNK
jgi:hypothetical protein